MRVLTPQEWAQVKINLPAAITIVKELTLPAGDLIVFLSNGMQIEVSRV